MTLFIQPLARAKIIRRNALSIGIPSKKDRDLGESLLGYGWPYNLRIERQQSFSSYPKLVIKKSIQKIKSEKLAVWCPTRLISGKHRVYPL